MLAYSNVVDTSYTERYMQTPELNPEGYDLTSVLKNAGNITNRFMLIHGTADDNGHFQNSVELVNQLIPTGLQFDTMYYPNRNHAINSDGSGGVELVFHFHFVSLSLSLPGLR